MKYQKLTALESYLKLKTCSLSIYPWCLQGLRRELGRKESVWWWLQVKALKYFLSQKGDLLTDISEIVSH